MDKFTVASKLEEIARYTELTETNRFKALAFERAARRIEALDADIAELVASGELYKTPGIGKAIGPIIAEIVQTGEARYLDDLRTQFPPGIFDLLRVPGFGLRKIGVVYSELGVGTLDELEEAARSGRLARLKGFGAKTAQKILAGIEFARRHESRFLLPTGLEVAELVRERLATIEAIEDAEVSGSVRRRLEVVSNVNVTIATAEPEKVIAAIRKRAIVDKLEAVDDATLRGVARGEMTVLFHLAHPDDFGAALLRTTGSEEFVEAFEEHASDAGVELRGLELYRNGRHVRAPREEDVFERAGIAFVDPERRESGDDLKRKRRTRLIEASDLRGTFHVHTTFSDGRNTVNEMLGAARERGFEYVGLSDHSKTASYAGGLTVEGVREQQAEIAREEGAFAPMRVFRGTEADILLDGAIDYDAETLSSFDFVVASVHSKFSMPKDEMTERILHALDNPFVTFLGHLTGRLLLSRDGYTMDFDRVFERAGKRGVMIEINGNPHRLDIDWRLINRALDRGVLFSINPDAHSTHEYTALVSGTWVARKAGLSTKEIFNSLPVDAVAEYLDARRKLAMKATGV